MVTNQWTRIAFTQQYDSPKFYADMQSFNDSDTAQVRYRNLTGTGVEVKIQEEQSQGLETRHAAEKVGFAVCEGSL